MRERAGLIKDKVSLRGHFGLQTEGNICVNLSTTGSPLWRGMQREVERRVGREQDGKMSMPFFFKSRDALMHLKLNLDSAISYNILCACGVTVGLHKCFQARTHECASCRNAKACNKSKLIY